MNKKKYALRDAIFFFQARVRAVGFSVETGSLVTGSYGFFLALARRADTSASSRSRYTSGKRDSAQRRATSPRYKSVLSRIAARKVTRKRVRSLSSENK